MNKFDEILKKYTKEDYPIIHKSIDELCKNGVGNGCYQDYSILVDILEVLAYFENIVKNKEGN